RPAGAGPPRAQAGAAHAAAVPAYRRVGGRPGARPSVAGARDARRGGPGLRRAAPVGATVLPDPRPRRAGRPRARRRHQRQTLLTEPGDLRHEVAHRVRPVAEPAGAQALLVDVLRVERPAGVLPRELPLPLGPA